MENKTKNRGKPNNSYLEREKPQATLDCGQDVLKG